MHPSTTAPASPLTPKPGPVAGDCPQCERLAAKIEDLQRNLTALQSQLASKQEQPAPRPAVAYDNSNVVSAPADPAAIESARAADAERHHEYMAGVERAFRNEQLDVSWAGHASSKVTATLDTDETLRNLAHRVECRRETCRVQIEDDGSGQLSRELPRLAMRVGDILPAISAERIDEGNGRGAMILYMSSHATAAGATTK